MPASGGLRSDLASGGGRCPTADFSGGCAETDQSDGLAARVRLVEEAITAVLRDPSARRLRKLRVATRRADAVLEGFGGARAKALRKALNRVRRGAGKVRDLEVMKRLLLGLEPGGDAGVREGIRHVAARLERARKKKSARLVKRLRRDRRRVREAAAEFLEGGERWGAGTAEAAAAELRRLGAGVREAAERGGDLLRPQDLHRLRIALRRLRYAVEIFGPCLSAKAAEGLLARLRAVQEKLGDANDVGVLLDALDQEAHRLSDRHETGREVLKNGIAALRERCASVRARRIGAALAELGPGGVSEILRELGKLLSDGGRPPPGVRAPDPRPVPVPGGAPEGPRRLAALDIGTNSIRLVVVEAHPDGTFRTLDDEKETTRLGRGMVVLDGRLSTASMERSAEAIARMRAIALGYGVGPGAIRIVGTSAVREASNRDEFLELVRREAGVEIEILDAEDEGKMAFLAVAGCADLSGTTSAVIDIGGGSTEIVLAAGGIIEEVYSLPLGAVRLTERFGGPEESSRERFEEMRRHISKVVRRVVGRPRLTPRLVAGTGGTFGAVAGMLSPQENEGRGPLLWDRRAPGYEATRPRIKHLIERVRRLPVAERCGVPGLRAERADIIVAGLAIAERVLKHLGSNSVVIHDRGIRDGLIITMAAGEFRRPGAAPVDPMRAVRRLAMACGYERAHSEHVRRLALQIHDQLPAALAARDGRFARASRIADLTAGGSARRLLEGAAVLHDIGYLADYSKHHKHSYHMIVHSDIASTGPLTSREVALIAQIARYHRRAEPKMGHPAFAALPARDRRLVRELAAVLRIADGLDRARTQVVRGVRLTLDGRDARFDVIAAHDPATDLWGAARKSGLFERVFGARVRFRWEHASGAESGAEGNQPPGVRSDAEARAAAPAGWGAQGQPAM